LRPKLEKCFLYHLKQYEKFTSLRIFVCMRIFSSEYSLECEIRLKFCEYSLQNDYFEAIIRQYEKMYLFCNKSNICIKKFVKYSDENMKRMMRINGVCDYTKTCEYEAKGDSSLSCSHWDNAEVLRKKLQFL
jgi:hypothetical protein